MEVELELKLELIYKALTNKSSNHAERIRNMVKLNESERL